MAETYPEGVLTVDLERDLYYLGRAVPEVLDVLLLRRDGTAIAPVFSSHEKADPWLGVVPDGFSVLRVGAQDPRARVELLAAFEAAGAKRLGLDPRPEDGAPRQETELGPELAYLRSLRNATACF